MLYDMVGLVFNTDPVATNVTELFDQLHVGLAVSYYLYYEGVSLVMLLHYNLALVVNFLNTYVMKLSFNVAFVCKKIFVEKFVVLHLTIKKHECLRANS